MHFKEAFSDELQKIGGSLPGKPYSRSPAARELFTADRKRKAEGLKSMRGRAEAYAEGEPVPGKSAARITMAGIRSALQGGAKFKDKVVSSIKGQIKQTIKEGRRGGTGPKEKDAPLEATSPIGISGEKAARIIEKLKSSLGGPGSLAEKK